MRAKSLLLALSPLSSTGEGMYLAGRGQVNLREFTRPKLWLEDMAHLLVLRDDDGSMRVHVLPLLGMEAGLVDVTNYTALGEMSGPLLPYYEEWLAAKKEGGVAVEDDVQDTEPDGSSVSDGTLGDSR